ncbi:VOC family protein [Cytophagales bacterium LB-30]|uniref:VOC family protein n=1 Tax=Shiella aurantiaca TaxID=3058365 RepID=A0ABT8F391_9BACT|nr:VOC family protein [Shiella aurantiaca]MDN4164926.1 VOC family protein [Shiella aurantiaca]
MELQEKIISGIQQVGIGIRNVDEAWAFYRKNFGFDVPVFRDKATANLMVRYTGGKTFSRDAVLALNMQGGGGFEIWQFTDRTPQPAEFAIQAGDLGIYAVKVKCTDVAACYAEFQKRKLDIVGPLAKNPAGDLHFYVRDPYGNVFEIVKGLAWFKTGRSLMGGVGGVTIGVTDMDKAITFYSSLLGYSQKVYDTTATFEDFAGLPGGTDTFRRVLLRHPEVRTGAFAKLLGPTEIELISVQSRTAKKMYENRFWGDLGFIHVCFDITGMKLLEKECATKGYPFTVDSANSFDMGEAAGHFSYCEDPDGTLIEFVETHRVPILKKLGLYLNLKNRKPGKALPNWMVSALGISRVKD